MVRLACEQHTLDGLISPMEDKPSAGFIRIICLGNLVTILSIEDLSNHTRHEIAEAIRADLACTEEEFLTLMGDIYDLKNEVEGFMGQFN